MSARSSRRRARCNRTANVPVEHPTAVAARFASSPSHAVSRIASRSISDSSPSAANRTSRSATTERGSARSEARTPTTTAAHQRDAGSRSRSRPSGTATAVHRRERVRDARQPPRTHRQRHREPPSRPPDAARTRTPRQRADPRGQRLGRRQQRAHHSLPLYLSRDRRFLPPTSPQSVEQRWRLRRFRDSAPAVRAWSRDRPWLTPARSAVNVATTTPGG
jgi:hypothetical protein